MSLSSKILLVLLFLLTLALSALCINLFLKNRDLKSDSAEIASALADSENTVKISETLFQRKVVELNDVKSLLNSRERDNAQLKELVEKQGAEIVSYTEIILKWKKKYEGLLASIQTETPPAVPGDPVRYTVDFSGELGPFTVVGKTITSPPETFLSIYQHRPIKLGVSLLQHNNGKWSAVVSDEGESGEYDVDISLSAVNRKYEKQDWRDMLSLNIDAGFLPSSSMGVGVLYGNKAAVGPKCSAFAGGAGVDWSCGISFMWRPFDK